jgi:aldose sugar dehydrogenase
MDTSSGSNSNKISRPDKLGTDYVNDIFVGDANTGRIYNFDLNKQRSALQLYGSLKDKIADNLEELSNATFANGFGRITDMDIGPDGYLYVLSAENKGTTIHKITIK